MHSSYTEGPIPEWELLMRPENRNAVNNPTSHHSRVYGTAPTQHMPDWARTFLVLHVILKNFSHSVADHFHVRRRLANSTKNDVDVRGPIAYWVILSFGSNDRARFESRHCTLWSICSMGYHVSSVTVVVSGEGVREGFVTSLGFILCRK